MRMLTYLATLIVGVLIGHFATLYLTVAEIEVTQMQETAAPDPATPKPGYLLIMGRGYDAEKLKAYAAALPPVYAQYGGSYIALARDVTVLEGGYDYQSVLISKWPSLDAVKAFWASPEYAEVRKLREGNGTFDVIAFEGLAAAR